MTDAKRVPEPQIVYVPHGGGPLPLLGDPGHAEMTKFLRTLGKELRRPSAILVISAHWEAERPTLTASPHPKLLFDYGGFPDEAYQFRYPAPGDADLARRVADHLRGASLGADLDEQRGLDHGVFVPLMLMFPDGDVPIVELSLVRGLDPGAHLEMGKALANLEHSNLLVVGSGMSFHNTQALMQGRGDARARSETFDRWLRSTCTDPGLSFEQREERLRSWESAPEARFCHPREEHLLPLHVCLGMTSNRAAPAEVAYSGELMGQRISSLLWR